jgi:hypothetical protein
VTHLKAAYESQEYTQLQKDQLQAQLPPGSRLLSLMASQDGAQLSRHIVFTNDQSVGLNSDRLKGMLQDQGLAFEHAGDASPDGAGKALFFKGREKEAIATVHRDADGLTTVVLNVVTHLERLQ